MLISSSYCVPYDFLGNELPSWCSFSCCRRRGSTPALTPPLRPPHTLTREEEAAAFSLQSSTLCKPRLLSQGTLGTVWRHLWLPQLGGAMDTGEAGTLLSLLQRGIRA